MEGILLAVWYAMNIAPSKYNTIASIKKLRRKSIDNSLIRKKNMKHLLSVVDFLVFRCYPLLGISPLTAISYLYMQVE